MLHNFKVFDDAVMLFDAVASGWFTVTDHDGTYIDLGGDDLDMENPGEVIVLISGMTSSGSATVALSLIDCDTYDGTYAALTPVGVAVAAADYDDALFDDTIRMPIPKFGVRQFLNLRVTIGTAALTAGTISAGWVK